MSDVGFYNFKLPFSRESLKIEFLLASMKSLTNSENPKRFSGFQTPTCDSKVGPKAACDPEFFSPKLA